MTGQSPSPSKLTRMAIWQAVTWSFAPPMGAKDRSLFVSFSSEKEGLTQRRLWH
jgi:hypothetical protein